MHSGAQGLREAPVEKHCFTVPVPVRLFQVDAGMMLYRVDSDVHLQTNEDW